MTNEGASAQRLFFWAARGLYIGPAFGLRPHRNAVAVLAVALDAPSRLDSGLLTGVGDEVEFRTALIPPNTLHHLRVPDGDRMAFAYVDALSEDYARMLVKMRVRETHFALGHAAERELIVVLLALTEGAPWHEARDNLAVLLDLSSAHHSDRRIANALARLHASPAQAHSLAQTARQACLSPSHFLHLFKTQTGVPFRRYRLWVRMGAALTAMRGGVTLTEAAQAAGFASSAHFSTAFSGMFGMPPSRLFRSASSPPAPTTRVGTQPAHGRR